MTCLATLPKSSGVCNVEKSVTMELGIIVSVNTPTFARSECFTGNVHIQVVPRITTTCTLKKRSYLPGAPIAVLEMGQV